MTREEATAVAQARNLAGGYANNLYAELVEIFSPLIGKKVTRCDNTLRKYVTRRLPDSVRPRGNRVRVKVRKAYWAIEFSVRAYAPVENSFLWGIAEWLVRVGAVEDRFLVKLYSEEVRRTDWTADEVLAEEKAAGA